MKSWLVSVILFLIIILGITFNSLKVAKNEAKRIESNYFVLSDTLKQIRAKNGDFAAKIGQLNLTVSEFKKIEKSLNNELSNLKIKAKNLQQIISATTNTRIDTIVLARDTAIFKDTLKVFRWADSWTSISGLIKKDSVKLSYSSTDSIDIIDVITPKRFLFFKWGVKSQDTYLVNKNKNTKITKGKHIKIKK